MIRLLFVYPNAVLQNPPPVSLALFYARLKEMDVEVHLFDTTLYDIEEKTSDKTKEKHLQVRPFDFSERGVALQEGDVFEDFRVKVAEVEPHLIALSSNEITFPLGLSLLTAAADLPEYQRAFKLAGGVFATSVPEKVLAHLEIDAVCIGEGEEVLPEVIEALASGAPVDSIRNLCQRGSDGSIIRNPLRPAVDLEALPLPDYDIFSQARYFRPMAGKVWKLFPIETSRGCPYGCTFCNSPLMSDIYRTGNAGRFFRKKSIARIDAELHDLVVRYQAEYIYFLSDTLLSMNDAEFDAFCRMYERYALPFWCQNRPEMVTEKRMRRLKDIGCHRMSIGIEHGNEEFRRRVLKKKVTNARIREALKILDTVGIPVSVNNIIGFPDETRELAFDTIRLNREIPWDTANAYAFTPFHGTELYRICLEKGYLDASTELKCLTKGSVLDMPQFPKSEIDGLVKTFALYSRLPEGDFSRIARAESGDEEGEKIFAELRQEYMEKYF